MYMLLKCSHFFSGGPEDLVFRPPGLEHQITAAAIWGSSEGIYTARGMDHGAFQLSPGGHTSPQGSRKKCKYSIKNPFPI